MEVASALGLKRRFEEVDSGSPYSTPKDSDDDVSSSDSADSCDSLNPPSTSSLAPTSILRRHKPPPGPKRVRFDAVTVYYFLRRQGFTSVPSQGGSSLGMARHHSAIRHYTLGDFAREQESSHRQALRQHLRQEKLNARKLKLTRNGTVECAAAETLTLEDVSDEDLDVAGVEVDDCFFLQPLPTKRRRALLRASGIARIDAREKAELRSIRLSREECGCDCRFYCDPQHCGCCQAGIKCQVDRMSFPCGCSRDGCGNAAGRIEFNPLRVRTHYLHTIMKLDLEKQRPLGVWTGEGSEAAELASASADPLSVALAPSAGTNNDAQPAAPSYTALAESGTDMDYTAQPDSLALENETAVLHLQSAEEQERRREQEEETSVVAASSGGLGDPGLCLLTESPGLIQGSFPEGSSLLCFSESQSDAPQQALLKDPSSLVCFSESQPDAPQQALLKDPSSLVCFSESQPDAPQQALLKDPSSLVCFSESQPDAPQQALLKDPSSLLCFSESQPDAPQQALLKDPSSLVIFSENQPDAPQQALLKDPSSLVYYQVAQAEPTSLGLATPMSEELQGKQGEIGPPSGQWGLYVGPPAEALPPSENGTGGEDGHLASEQGSH